MRRFILCSLATLGLISSIATAQCGSVGCGTAYGVSRVTYNAQPVYHAPVVTHQSYVTKHIEAIVVPLYVPAYQAIANPNVGVLPYQPQPNQQASTPAQPSDTDRILTAIGGVRNEINEVKNDVNGLKKRVEDIERKGNGSTLPTPTPVPNPPFKNPDPLGPKAQSSTSDIRSQALGIYKASCAQCHDASKAADEGGDFILLVGDNKATINDKEKAKMVSKIQKRGTGQMPPVNNKYHLDLLTPQQIEIVKLDNQ